MWSLLICGTIWLNVLVGDWVWVFAYHSFKGMSAFSEWQTNPTADSQARWLAEKARMDATAERVRWVQFACLALPPILVFAVFRRTRIPDTSADNPGRITMQ